MIDTMRGVCAMSEVKIVGRGVDTLVLNVCYADKQFQPIKQELNADLQECYPPYRMKRVSMSRRWCQNGPSRASRCICSRKGRVGNGAGYSPVLWSVWRY